MPATAHRALIALSASAALLLAGCAAPVEAEVETTPPAETSVPQHSEPVEPDGSAPTTVVEGLAAPWSMAVLESGSVLVSERDSARVLEVTPERALREAGSVPGVVAGGEGGLMGLAVWEEDGALWLYAMHTAADDNRVVRMPLEGEPGSYALGAAEPILTGLPRAGNHNGGRIAFGPDDHLYVTAGDAARPGIAQDAASLGGKILRVEPDGTPAGATEGSAVWSLGHRNPQGLAWDGDDRLWAAEFGQSTWDELNLIEPGADYGWPTVEGQAGAEGFVDPVLQWSTDEASPSGLAFVRGTFFLASLRGERVWVIHPRGDGTTAEAEAFLTGELGRIRDVAEGPDGTLWILTNNTDGRGDARPGDDRIVSVPLRPVPLEPAEG